jgi:hypothetical protein
LALARSLRRACDNLLHTKNYSLPRKTRSFRKYSTEKKIAPRGTLLGLISSGTQIKTSMVHAHKTILRFPKLLKFFIRLYVVVFQVLSFIFIAFMIDSKLFVQKICFSLKSTIFTLSRFIFAKFMLFDPNFC